MATPVGAVPPDDPERLPIGVDPPDQTTGVVAPALLELNDPSDTDLRGRTLRGLSWTFIASVSTQVASTVLTVVLARILVPRDFGLVGMAALITGLASLLSNLGFGQAIVQIRELREVHVVTVFWANVIAGLLLALVVAGLAPLVADFYGQPRVLWITVVMGLNFAVAIDMAPIGLLERSMRFKALSILDFTTMTAGSVGAVIMAALGGGAWSLVLPNLVATMLRTMGLYRVARWRPRRRPDRASFDELWRFGGGITGFNLINYWARNGDNLLIGKFLGPTDLGYYARAYNFMLLPLSNISSVVSRVMLPALATMQDDRERTSRIYVRTTALIAVVAMPILGGMAAVAPEFVRVVLGPKWTPITTTLRLLCITGMLQTLSIPQGWLFQTQRRTGLMFRWGLVSTTVIMVIFGVSVTHGIVGVAAGYLAGNVLLLYPGLYLSGGLVGMRPGRVLAGAAGPAIATAVMIGAVEAVRWALHRSPVSAGPRLALLILVGAVIYPACLWASRPYAYRELGALLGHRGPRWIRRMWRLPPPPEPSAPDVPATEPEELQPVNEDLAIDGGRPLRDDYLIFGQPVIEEAEIDEVVDSLRRRWIGTGPKVARFEEMVRTYVGTFEAKALHSCTAGLQLSLLAAGVGPGDEVITSALTFAATVNAILHTGATPVLVDVNRTTQNIDPAAVAAAVTERTRAIMPVHMSGRPCDMDALADIARRHNLLVVEDAAHALGAEYHGRRIGSLSDLTVFSFYATKNITTGEGGMVTTDNAEWAQAIETYALHGLSSGAWKRYSDDGFKHYGVVLPGFKYNMMDLQAAIGLHQFPRLEQWRSRRDEIWASYDRQLADLPLQVPAPVEPGTVHARHLYTVCLDTAAVTGGRDWVQDALHREGIGTGIHFRAVHEHPYFAATLPYRIGEFPNAEWISNRTLSLPLSPGLSESDVADVVQALHKVIRGNGRRD